MGNVTISFTSARVCGFCKHWFDPCCGCIRPKDTAGNVWEVQNSTQRPCVLHHQPKLAMQSCPDFEMKL